MVVTLATSDGETTNLAGTVTLVATPSGAITRAEFSIAGEYRATVSSAPYTYDWDTTGSENGGVQASVKVFYSRRQVLEQRLDVSVWNMGADFSPLPPALDGEPAVIE